MSLIKETMAKLVNVNIKNFRIHQNSSLSFDKFQIFVGKNDAGKTSILDALDIFFNGEEAKRKIAKSDFSHKDEDVSIQCQIDDKVITKVISSTNLEAKLSSDVELPKYLYFDTDRSYKCISRFTLSGLVNHFVKDEMAKKFYKDNYPYRKLLKRGFNPLDIKNLYQSDLTKLVNGSIINNIFDVFRSIDNLKDFAESDNIVKQCFEAFLNSHSQTELLDNKEHIMNSLKVYDVKLMSNLSVLYKNIESENDFFSELTGSVYISDTNFLKMEVDDTTIADIFNLSDVKEIISYERVVTDNFYYYVIKNLVNDIPFQLLYMLKNIEEVENSTISKHIKLKNRGCGVQRLCALYYQFLDMLIKGDLSDSNIFAIDEPEISLHPSQQALLIKHLRDFCKSVPNVQFIINTHSVSILKEFYSKSIYNPDSTESVYVLTGRGQEYLSVNPLQERCISYEDEYHNEQNTVSINEIIYIAFNEPSAEYLLELIAYMTDKFELSISALDHYLSNMGVPRNNIFTDYRGRTSSHTLPYCVRNQITHPNSKNSVYNDTNLLIQAIEILRNTIQNPVLSFEKNEIKTLTIESVWCHKFNNDKKLTYYVANFTEYPNGIVIIDRIVENLHPEWVKKSDNRAYYLSGELRGLKVKVRILNIQDETKNMFEAKLI